MKAWKHLENTSNRGLQHWATDSPFTQVVGQTFPLSHFLTTALCKSTHTKLIFAELDHQLCLAQHYLLGWSNSPSRSLAQASLGPTTQHALSAQDGVLALLHAKHVLQFWSMAPNTELKPMWHLAGSFTVLTKLAKHSVTNISYLTFPVCCQRPFKKLIVVKKKSMTTTVAVPNLTTFCAIQGCTFSWRIQGFPNFLCGKGKGTSFCHITGI